MRDDWGDNWRTDGTREDGDEHGLETVRYTRRHPRPTANEKRRFIELCQMGVPRDAAARAIGSTATRVHREQKRDVRFGAAVVAAEEQGAKGGDNHQDLIRGYLHEVAFGHLFADKAEHPKAVEVAKILADTWLPEHSYKRTRQVEHGQKAPFEFIIGQRVPEEVLLAMPPEERRLLLEAVRMLEEGQQRLRLIEGGATNGKEGA